MKTNSVKTPDNSTESSRIERQVEVVDATERPWTPGPWEVFGDDYSLAVGPNKHSIVARIVPFMRGSPMYEKDKANARLIAAAPTLYDALEATRQILAEYESDEALQIQARAIDAALSLARGEK